MSSQTPTTLDLHGRRFEEAISEVTLFLERIRRTVAKSSRGRSGNILYVKIITGAGSHSSHGPVLRSAVQRLLEKRGMHFKLERGGGAFQVDALSGITLYGPAPVVDSKVVVSEQDDFHQLALLRRKNTVGGNVAHATMAQCTAASRSPRTVSVPNSSYNRNRTVPVTSNNSYNRSTSISSDPLPIHVASEDKNMRTATQLSITESQQRDNQNNRMSKQFEREFERAVSESKLEHITSKQRETEFEEEEESQLKMAYKQSRMDEHDHQQLTEEQYEDALMLAMEQSTEEANNADTSEDDLLQQALAQSVALAEAKKAKSSEDDVLEKVLASTQESNNATTPEEDLVYLRQALADSLALAEAEKANSSEDDVLEKVLASTQESNNSKTPEEDLFRQALAESLALAEAEKASNSEDDLLEKALAASLLEEEKRKTYHHEQEAMASFHGVDLLEEVTRLSLQQKEEEAKAEEEAMKNAIEMSKHIR